MLRVNACVYVSERKRKRERSREIWWWLNVIGGGCHTLVLNLYPFYDLFSYIFFHKILSPSLSRATRTSNRPYSLSREINRFSFDETSRIVIWSTLKAEENVACDRDGVTLLISVNTHTRSKPFNPDPPPCSD